jgi:hypothetical protein
MSTIRSLDALERTIKWYAEYRSRVFAVVALSALGALGFIFRAAVTASQLASAQTERNVAIGMVAGSILAMIVDMVMASRQRSATYRGIDYEKTTGSEVPSFDLLLDGLVLNLRFLLCYSFILALGASIVASPNWFLFNGPV